MHDALSLGFQALGQDFKQSQPKNSLFRSFSGAIYGHSPLNTHVGSYIFNSNQGSRIANKPPSVAY